MDRGCVQRVSVCGQQLRGLVRLAQTVRTLLRSCRAGTFAKARRPGNWDCGSIERAQQFYYGPSRLIRSVERCRMFNNLPDEAVFDPQMSREAWIYERLRVLI
jgi:hypothetical protein